MIKTVCVIGLGYIGLPTASLLANSGFRVIGVDSNPEVRKLLASGMLHIEEAGLRTLVEAATGSGQLTLAPAPGAADAYIICVPTPVGRSKEPDLSYVFDAARSILPHLRIGNLVVVESTVPPGTTAKIAKFIQDQRPDLCGLPEGGSASGSVHFAHCPERVLPGRILTELVDNDRVIGGLTEEATHLASELYRRIVSGKIHQTNATTAEMTKLSENTFRDVNIALSNELAVICQKLGISVWEVIGLANKHPRVRILNPGPGVGGHCIAVDPWFIVSDFQRESTLIQAARLQNDAMPSWVVDQIIEFLGGEKNPKIACLGIAYKGNVGDDRNSPALEICRLLASKLDRATISIHDVHVKDSKVPMEPLENVLNQASLIVLLTDHNEYKELDPVDVAARVKRKLLFDTRNQLDHARWRSAGFDVKRLGDGLV